MDFSKPPVRIEEILKTIARAPSGRKILERFLPLFHQGTVRIEAYPTAIVARMREVLEEGQPVGASFIHNGETGVIYLDLSSPLGILAPFLLHEMVHSLDPEVWRTPHQDLARSGAKPGNLHARPRTLCPLVVVRFATPFNRAIAVVHHASAPPVATRNSIRPRC